MSRSAPSGAVAAPAESLGVRLLEDTRRKVLLSPAGVRLERRTRRVLAAVAGLLDHLPTTVPSLVRRDRPEAELRVHEQQTASPPVGPRPDGSNRGRPYPWTRRGRPACSAPARS